MSGYRHSGLSEKEFEDREKLEEAVEVLSRRWPECDDVIYALEALSEGIGHDR